MSICVYTLCTHVRQIFHVWLPVITICCYYLVALCTHLPFLMASSSRLSWRSNRFWWRTKTAFAVTTFKNFLAASYSVSEDQRIEFLWKMDDLSEKKLQILNFLKMNCVQKGCFCVALVLPSLPPITRHLTHTIIFFFKNTTYFHFSHVVQLL